MNQEDYKIMPEKSEFTFSRFRALVSSCLLWSLFLCGGSPLFAQTSIFDALTVREPGKGTVTLHQSSTIRSFVENRTAEEKIETIDGRNYLLMQGFRIQVYSGNNQRTSKGEADSRKSQIDNMFSDVSTYVTYTAPFWRLRVGNYASYEEAFSMMSKLVNAFPAFRREIQILREAEII
jgi:hypothetical protein